MGTVLIVPVAVTMGTKPAKETVIDGVPSAWIVLPRAPAGAEALTLNVAGPVTGTFKS